MMVRTPWSWAPIALAVLAAGCESEQSKPAAQALVASVIVHPDGTEVQAAGSSITLDFPPDAVDSSTEVRVFQIDPTAFDGVNYPISPMADSFGALILSFEADQEIRKAFLVQANTNRASPSTGIQFGLFVPFAQQENFEQDTTVFVSESPRIWADVGTGLVRTEYVETRIAAMHTGGILTVLTPVNVTVVNDTTTPGPVPPPLPLAVEVGQPVDIKFIWICEEDSGVQLSGSANAVFDMTDWALQGGCTGGTPFQIGHGQLNQAGSQDCYSCEATVLPTRQGGCSATWHVTVDPGWIAAISDLEVTCPYALDVTITTEVQCSGQPVSEFQWEESDQFSGPVELPFAVGTRGRCLGGKLGVAFPDLDAGTIPRQAVSNVGAHTIGAAFLIEPNIRLSRLAVTTPTAQAMVAYANTGYGIRHWLPAIDDFGATEIDPNSGSVSDADTYEQDSSRAVVVQSGRNQVRFVEYVTDPFPPFNARFTMLDPLAKGIAASLFPGATGYVISAARRTDTSPVYFVTVGATPDDPGSLWRKNDPADRVTPATLVGGVGNAPRRIRFLKTIGIVSNSFSDTLTILVRDASDNVTVKGTVAVGDGPIGIDLIELANGDIGVLSTGFLDNTYTVTILEPDGDVVSNVTAPVPNGGEKPSSAAWADDLGTRIAVSCGGTHEVVLFSRP